MMIKAVFFDLYGTLAGFNPSRYEIQNAACDPLDIKVTQEGIAAGYALADSYMAQQNAINPLRQRDRDGTTQFFAEYEQLVLKGAGVDVTREQAWEIWLRVQRVPSQLTLFDDVLPAMALLKSNGLILAIISNMNRDGGELLTNIGLTSYIDFAITSAEVGAEKPHPPIFQAALNNAKVLPEEAMHVGDQILSDIEGAMGMGINPVLLDRDGNHSKVEGFPRIESLMELTGLLSGY